MALAQRYQIHPLAAAFPALAGQDLADLIDDIKRRGVREPIVLYEGKILDGRNRYVAAELAGLADVPVREFDAKKAGCTPEEFVISMNLVRRHLTPSQKSALAIEFMERMAVGGGRRNGKTPLAMTHADSEAWEDLAADLHKTPETPSGAPQTALAAEEPVNELQREREADLARELASRNGGARKRRERSVVAEKFGVSEGLIDAARRVKARSPELHEAVKAGQVSVQQALKEALVATGEAGLPPRAGLSLESRVRELVAAAERAGGKVTVGEYKFTVKKIIK
jgi:ParB-like nuclease family protein